MEACWSALFPIVYRDLAIYVLLVLLLIWRPGDSRLRNLAPRLV